MAEQRGIVFDKTADDFTADMESEGNTVIFCMKRRLVSDQDEMMPDLP